MRIAKSLERSLVRAVLVGGKVITRPFQPDIKQSTTVRNRRRIPTLMRTAATSFLISLALLLPATAATFEVNTLNDAGPGSLRQAITDANASAENDMIQISVPGSIVLQTDLPALLGTVTISGLGANRLAISPVTNAVFQGPIFNVDATAVVLINGVTIEKCRNGAVVNRGMLTLEQCVLRRNQRAQVGGAILNLGNLVVRRSTLSDNVARGDTNGGSAHGGAILNGENGHLSVVSSTISGNKAVGGDGVFGNFLTKKFAGSASQSDSDIYYNLVDPPDAQHPLGRRTTLGAWWQENGFDPTDGSAPGEAKAAYLNNGDLGFGRDMHILQRGSDVVSYVSNYTLNLDRSSPDQNPLSADAAAARDPERAIATVCMEYSPINNPVPTAPVVKFFVYQGVGPNAIRVGGADLDGNGVKFTPQLCMVCHGGTPPPGNGWTLNQVLASNSHFREFDLASFKFPRPGTRVDDPSRSSPNTNTTVDEQAAFRSLNEKVLAANPSAAIRELVQGWYGGPGLPQSTQNTTFVPVGWQSQAQLYRDVVGTSCRTCHVAQEGTLNFDAYSKFSAFRFTIENEVISSTSKVMPHARVAFANFWRDGRANTLANFTGPGWPQIGTGNITGGPGGEAAGAGIYSMAFFSQPAVDIVTSTIAFNSAASGVGTTISGATGGGFYRGNGSWTLGNTLIANNFVQESVFFSRDLRGNFTSNGFNLIGNTSDATIGNPQPSDLTDIVNPKISPLLGRLAKTPFHVLLYDSPAVDKGSAATDPSSGLLIATDQRGAARPLDFSNIPPAGGGDNSDIGAYERVSSVLRNISTRGQVLNGGSVLIGGFIVVGDSAKDVLIRAAGPSLAAFGIPGVLADPVLELHGPSPFATITNDNWRDTQEAQIIATGIPPTNDLEPAIVTALAPGAYTAIVRGGNGGTGVGIVEVYDLAEESVLANISTRGFVGTGDDVMIGGMIVQGEGSLPVVVRAIGPSLSVSDALADPALELRDGNGALVAANDNWRSDQEADLIATTIPPSSDLESALVQTLAPGNYTAIVRGLNNTTGVALVEAYSLE